MPPAWPVSVLVLTKNEEANIAGCLESVRWADEVFVVDSLSTDRTTEIAEAMGGKVYRHPFEGFSQQRNWALDNLPFSHDWILVLDADERIPPELAAEIGEAIRPTDNKADGFYLDRRLCFLGRWLTHGGLSPNWILRLFRRGHGRFEMRPMNEHVILTGTAAFLRHPFDHLDNRPLSHWIAKHNGYTDLQAQEYLLERNGTLSKSLRPRFFASHIQRRRWIKTRLWNRMPLLLRPFVLFFRNYLIKRGFLDGKAGFIYHVLWSFWYPFLVDVKIVERRMQLGKAAEVPEERANEVATAADPCVRPSDSTIR